MENELEDLKEIAITKIKAAFNRSIDIEATHIVLWDKSERNGKVKLIIILILSLIAASSYILTLNYTNLNEVVFFIFFADIFALIVVVFIIWEIFLRLSGRSENHGHLVNEVLNLRDQSMTFLQYKLDNLDKKGYIDELKSLEINDKNLKDKSTKYAKRLSKKVKNIINKIIEDLEKKGIRKHTLTQEEIDSANEKLQKFTVLRTCEAWIKFT